MGRLGAVVEQGSLENIDWKKDYIGTIVVFHKDLQYNVPSMRKKDYGTAFISCEETHKIFQLNVWVHPAKLGGMNVGDMVRFKISIDHSWSWPVAHDVRLIDSETVKKSQEALGLTKPGVGPQVHVAGQAQ